MDEPQKEGIDSSRPIWHSPGWITAMVGVVSAFLTVPDVVGNYLSKKQDIELKTKEVALADIKNADEEKKNLFKVLVTTLGQRGEDRATTLRFIAATSESKEIKAWAAQEISLFAQAANRVGAQQGAPADRPASASLRQDGG